MKQLDQVRFLISIMKPEQTRFVRALFHLHSKLNWEMCGRVLDNPRFCEMLLTPEQQHLFLDCCIRVLNQDATVCTPETDNITYARTLEAFQGIVSEANPWPTFILAGRSHSWAIMPACGSYPPLFIVQRLLPPVHELAPSQGTLPEPADKGPAPALRLVHSLQTGDDDDAAPSSSD